MRCKFLENQCNFYVVGVATVLEKWLHLDFLNRRSEDSLIWILVKGVWKRPVALNLRYKRSASGVVVGVTWFVSWFTTRVRGCHFCHLYFPVSSSFQLWYQTSDFDVWVGVEYEGQHIVYREAIVSWHVFARCTILLSHSYCNLQSVSHRRRQADSLENLLEKNSQEYTPSSSRLLHPDLDEVQWATSLIPFSCDNNKKNLAMDHDTGYRM